MQVLNSVQLATFIVNVYPHGPDVLAVINVVAEERGEMITPPTLGCPTLEITARPPNFKLPASAWGGPPMVAHQVKTA